jgi:hypothetical protein
VRHWLAGDYHTMIDWVFPAMATFALGQQLFLLRHGKLLLSIRTEDKSEGGGHAINVRNFSYRLWRFNILAMSQNWGEDA